MQRDRALFAAFGGALVLLLALVFGGRNEAVTSIDTPAVRSGSAAAPRLVAAIASRTLRLRPAQAELSPDADGRVAAAADGAAWFDARPTALAGLVSRAFSENLSRPPARSHERAWSSGGDGHRPEARAPPV